MIVHKHGTPNNTTFARVALLSDVPHNDPHATASKDLPTLKECTDIYDDKEVSISFNLVAFSSSLTPGPTSHHSM
jgi:hypothetical protein